MDMSNKFNAGVDAIQNQSQTMGYKRGTAAVFNLAAALEKRGITIRPVDGNGFDK